MHTNSRILLVFLFGLIGSFVMASEDMAAVIVTRREAEAEAKSKAFEMRCGAALGLFKEGCAVAGCQFNGSALGDMKSFFEDAGVEIKKQFSCQGRLPLQDEVLCGRRHIKAYINLFTEFWDYCFSGESECPVPEQRFFLRSVLPSMLSFVVQITCLSEIVDGEMMANIEACLKDRTVQSAECYFKK